MKICSAYISLLLMTLVYAQKMDARTDVREVVDSSRVMFMPDSTETLQLSFSMQRKDMEFSGLLIEKVDNYSLLGVIMNEFGVRAFNFSYDLKTEKLEICDIIPFLDKFYIKPALKGLMLRLFTLRRYELGKEIKHCVGIISEDGNELTLIEQRYGLTLIVAKI